MPLQKGQNPNHPAKGSHIRVEPIREKAAIKRIKAHLVEQPRNLCLFTLGINTAFRASELLSIRVGQVRYGETELEVREKKTGKRRRVTLNPTALAVVRAYLDTVELADDAALFTGKRGVLTVPTVTALVKKWCKEAGLRGNYGSHTLRKTWGYWQRVANHTPVPLLMEAFGHATQRQTLHYLGIQDEEIRDVYLGMEL
jgi:integrase